jgi:uncharacterized repeat protein (TIGR03803 family)
MSQLRACKGLSLPKIACIVSMFLAQAGITCQAQTFTTLINFDGANGAQPVYVPLAQGNDGNLYGTTLGGGPAGAGTIFKVTPSGELTTIYNFCTQNLCPDGDSPYAGLVRANNGNFYGTTFYGGKYGNGTVFKVTATGVLTTLHSFDYAAGEGAQPSAPLTQAQNGDLYGTTSGGGPSNAGTIFEITPSGALATLHAFDGSDGSDPNSSLVQGNDGNFYGTAGQFVFRMTPTGTLTTLHTFSGTDGSYPNGLMRGTDGNFYGSTYGGGANNTCNNGCGTIFRITPAGVLTTLYNFDATHGANPVAVLTQGTDNNFYGTTYAGGTEDWGTVFEMTPAGALTSLHSFDGSDGGQPYGPVAQSTNGIFYGTATNVGPSNDGTLFSLSVGLGPFVETAPAFGKVGTTVVILGTNLTATNGVLFGSTGATFTVVSATEIKTVVPVGAVTGRVKVTNPNGTLTSNTIFRVTP